MRILNQKSELVLTGFNSPEDWANTQLKRIEQAGRVAYKSEDKITEDSCHKFVKMLVNKNHGAVLEFGHLTVKFITNRGVTHEFVRHRIPSYCQESTRYCNYSKDKFDNELAFIYPSTFVDWTIQAQDIWRDILKATEKSYKSLISQGLTAQQARGILPNDLKTEIIVDTNLREWKHILELRTSPNAHPDIRKLLTPVQKRLHEYLPEIF